MAKRLMMWNLSANVAASFAVDSFTHRSAKSMVR